MTLYGVVNMDIVASRKKSKELREKIQHNLFEYIEYINKKFKGILVAPVELTLGDEWQLITLNPESSYNIIHEFQKLIWKDNFQFYAGVGIGTLSTDIYDDTRKMDGECFLNARKALEIVKNNSYSQKYIHSKNNRVFFYSPTMNDIENNLSIYKNEFDIKEVAATSKRDSQFHQNINIANLINTIIENNEILINKMTKKQQQIYLDYIELGTYRKIIEEKNTKETIGGISQKLNNAEFFTIQQNYKMIEKLFAYYCDMRRE
ncbi:hypothetical protein GOQ27_00615 [Clostridium sp. D2Q-11]|uniref:SatD family (SatD) n=1 Tax=Anaeromonas frigoriresistens TaxID=2683708 RepID=A0A942US61_9FIRM|nr:SatD family protein [Anaeromonas frigoriresistens]MBS4536940.1 hypothetical protein [Anaeromonas frigoriresistens]